MIFVCFSVLTIAFIALYSAIVQRTYEKKVLEQKKNYTITQSNILLNQLVSSGYFNGNTNRNLENQIEQLATLFDGRIMLLDTNYEVLTDTYQLNQGRYLVSENAIKAMTGILSEDENNQVKEDYIECYIPAKFNSNMAVTEDMDEKPLTDDGKKNIKDSNAPIGMMVVFASVKDSYTTLDYVKQQSNTLFVLFCFCILVVAVVITMVLTGHFREFTQSINTIAEGHTDGTLLVHGFTEMRNLAEAFNSAVAKLNKLEESRQEFVSNVSHELKTPITSIKVLADSLLTQEDIPAEVYREFMEDIVDEIDRENKIINDLLSLVKMDQKSNNVLNVATVNINELLELLLKRLRPLAAKRNIEIVYESFRAVSAEIDEVKLTLALSNLVENAIKYNNDDGWIRITLNADHKYFYVKIADSGVGIPKDCQDHVFERFYRVDKARSRDTGGTGLGLAITHRAISMHHGTIKLHSKPGEGTTFTVRIPLTYSVNMAASIAGQNNSDEEKHTKMLHHTDKKVSAATTTTVPVPNVTEVQGNLGEVLNAANQNLLNRGEEKAEEKNSVGTIVTEPAPLENAEPEMVVLHTEEMDTPEVVVLSTEVTENSDKPSDNENHNSLENGIEMSEFVEDGSDDAAPSSSEKGGQSDEN